MNNFRIEKDSLGEKEIPQNSLWGIHTLRAVENFPISSQKIPDELIIAFGQVKLACARTNQNIGYLNEKIGAAIQTAAIEVTEGKHNEQIIVDAYQGGAGTSTNMNINEVIANRALIIMGKKPGEYSFCDPLIHVNMHQSTNDTYPTALKIAIYRKLMILEEIIIKLQEICQDKEKEFSNVIKIGRTELMDAVPLTLGRTFGAWAEVLGRDRWRIYKCTERIRVINLGGTAIGTGLCAPKEYIFGVTEEIKRITRLPLARAENLIDATQNLDSILEAMGLIKTHAANLIKISNDLRLLNMGPDSGISEIELPPVQVGSSIMPNKFNPVIPEMVIQVCMQIFAFEQAITYAISSGQLELNPFLPLIAFNSLESLKILTNADSILINKCLTSIKANIANCIENCNKSKTFVTLLIPYIGYYKACKVADLMKEKSFSFQEAVLELTDLNNDEIQQIISSQNINSLGHSNTINRIKNDE